MGANYYEGVANFKANFQSTVINGRKGRKTEQEK